MCGRFRIRLHNRETVTMTTPSSTLNNKGRELSPMERVSGTVGLPLAGRGAQDPFASLANGNPIAWLVLHKIFPASFILWVCLCCACSSQLSDNGRLSQEIETPTPEASTQSAPILASAKIGSDPKGGQIPEPKSGPTTAKALLAKIDSGVATDQWSELTTGEAEQAAAVLRTRYPLTSIRDRLAFQSRDPVPPQKKSVLERASRELHSNRARSLEALHAEEVQAFINRPGFGFDRGPRPNPYDLKFDGDYVRRLISRPIDSGLLGEPVVTLPEYTEPTERGGEDVTAIWSFTNGMPNRELVRVFHILTARDFASPDSTGYVKSLDLVAGFRSHRIRHHQDWDGSLRIWSKGELSERYPDIKEWGIVWRINRLQLMSLLIHETPRVYVSENLPDMDELGSRNAETRPLNDFEASGLGELNRGEDVSTIATPNRIVMLGSIRASESCLHCHDGQPDKLLGAFSYEMLREPRLDLKSDSF